MQAAYNQPQSAALPYSTEGPQTQPYQINYNALPFVPNGIQTAPWMTQYVPFTTGVVMDFLTRSCTNGKLSMFLYNMMSVNGWNNVEFVNLVQDVADYIYIENQQWQPPPHQIEQIIGNAVGSFLSLRMYGCLGQYPQLWYYINQTDQQVVQQQLQNYQNYMARISRMRQETAVNPGVGQPVGYHPQMMMPAQGNQSYMPQGRPQGHQPFTQAGQSFYSSGQVSAGPGYGPQVSRSGGGRDFGGAAPANQAPAQQVQQPQQMQAPIQPPSTLVPPIQPNQPPAQPNNQNQAQGKVTPMNSTGNQNYVTPDEATWRMSMSHPALCYPPAFNPVTHHLFFQIQPDGSTTPALQESNVNMIDYDRHKVASLFGKPLPGSYVARDNKQVMAKLDVGVEVIKKEMDEATEESPTILTKPKLLQETSLESAILTLRAECMQLQDSKKPTVFRGFARVFTPIIGWDSESDQIQAFAKCSSYLALREEIKGAAETASAELLATVNLRVTDHLNHILRHRLSIAKETVQVEDFVADLDPLLAFLNDNFGENIQRAFLKDQKHEIAMLFQTVDREEDGQEEVYQALTSNILADEFEGKPRTPQVTYIGQTFSITFIDIISHDLQVAGVEGVGNVVIQEFQPVLTALARNILESSDHLGWNASRHLVRTKDGRTFEVTKGNINDDFVLINLVR